LIGIVKKNAIMMVDFALGAERTRNVAGAGDPAGCCCGSPIMMTTMAALLGALPLAVGTGTGSEFASRRRRIVGGLVLSQFLTLYTTPVIYLASLGCKNASAQAGAHPAPAEFALMNPFSARSCARSQQHCCLGVILLGIVAYTQMRSRLYRRSTGDDRGLAGCQGQRRYDRDLVGAAAGAAGWGHSGIIEMVHSAPPAGPKSRPVRTRLRYRRRQCSGAGRDQHRNSEPAEGSAAAAGDWKANPSGGAVIAIALTSDVIEPKSCTTTPTASSRKSCRNCHGSQR